MNVDSLDLVRQTECSVIFNVSKNAGVFLLGQWGGFQLEDIVLMTVNLLNIVRQTECSIIFNVSKNAGEFLLGQLGGFQLEEDMKL